MDSSKENRKLIEELLIKLKNEVNLSSITELPNTITKNIDLAVTGREILNLLSKTDQEIFDGWKLSGQHFDSVHLKTNGLNDDLYILEKLSRLSQLFLDNIYDQIKNKSNQTFKLILSGCGTSGRLAYLCSQSFNEYVRKTYNYTGEDLCDYIIAGDEYALVNSVESVEDKPKVGAEKLKKKLDQTRKCIFIGITCGLSAPFVAGQIDYCLDIMKTASDNIIACCVIGFNPIEMARKTNPINEKNESFLDLMVRMKQLESIEPHKYFILNPLIGPEPITGSSRMKSGTTTKILVDIILAKALYKIDHEDNVRLNELDFIKFYKLLLEKVIYCESSIENLGNIIDEASISLKNLSRGGSVNYLADSERLGLLCCVDASECLPTYGAEKRDIKGFISVGSDGNSLSTFKKGLNYWASFIKACTTTWSQIIIDNLKADFSSEYSLFIMINHNDNSTLYHESNIPNKENIKNILRTQTNSKIAHIDVDKETNKELGKILIQASEINEYFGQCLQEFVLKLSINAISTGAHILIGKTYENIMIDVKVSNEKLYWRAIGILQKFSNKSFEECEKRLLDSIYGCDYLSNEHHITKHIEKATNESLIVPKALIMLLTECNYNEAVRMLKASSNSVRTCIRKLKNSQN